MDKLPVGEPVYAVEDTVTHPVGATDIQPYTDFPVCVLWIPDPEQRHGWREFYVQRRVTKVGIKSMGFKKK